MQTGSRIVIVTHAPRGSRLGNRVTALRWSKFLRQAGHHVRIVDALASLPALLNPSDAVIFLHARRCANFQRQMVASADPNWQRAAWIMALTGTDIYGGWPDQSELEFAVKHCDGLIALQEDMRQRLPTALRDRCTVIYQSATVAGQKATRGLTPWTILVSGHLRRVKAPFDAISALHHYLPTSQIHIRHCGGEIEPGFIAQAQAWQNRDKRYVYLGELSRSNAAKELQDADVLVNASEQEGGPAIVTEAIVVGIPVIASDIPAHRALLGNDYPALFALHDEQALAALLERSKNDPEWYRELRTQLKQRAVLFSPAHEAQTLLQFVAAMVGKRR